MYHARKPELEAPRRVIVIGSPGAEKGALARAIAERLKIPCLELERLYWRPGWRKPTRRGMARAGHRTGRPRAMGDGGHVPVHARHSRRPRRLARLRRCAHAGLLHPQAEGDGPRPPAIRKAEAAPGCPQRIDTRLLRFIWTFPTSIGPRINTIIARERRNRTIFILRSKREQEDFLAKVPMLGDLGRDAAGPQPGG